MLRWLLLINFSNTLFLQQLGHESTSVKDIKLALRINQNVLCTCTLSVVHVLCFMYMYILLVHVVCFMYMYIVSCIYDVCMVNNNYKTTHAL